MNHLVLDIRLSLQTPLHTGGNSWHRGIDKTAARSFDGCYVIPATTLKGFLRAGAESIMKTWGFGICQPPEPESMCHDPATMCVVCRTFGNPRLTAPLKFSEARSSPGDLVASARSGISISRSRRAALAQRLFFTETVASLPTTEWVTTAMGYFPTPRTAAEAAALISLAAQAGRFIGGGCSRGLGWIKLGRVQAKLDGRLLSEIDHQPFWKTWAGGRVV